MKRSFADEDPPLVDEREALRELFRIYRAADALYAKATCAISGDCCQLELTGREPYLFPIELTAILEELAASGRTVPPPREDKACPLLDSSSRRCSVYRSRPFGCRTFFCSRGRGAMPKNLQVHQLSARITALADSFELGVRPRTIRALLAERSGKTNSG